MQLKGRRIIFKDAPQIGLFLINNSVLHIFFLEPNSAFGLLACSLCTQREVHMGMRVVASTLKNLEK